MNKIRNLLSLKKGRRGQSTVEYVVILLVIVGIVVFLGKPLKKQARKLVNQVFGKITGQLDSAGGGDE